MVVLKSCTTANASLPFHHEATDKANWEEDNAQNYAATCELIC